MKELMAATDWLPHSIRGLVSSLIRQGGQKIEAINRESGERAHHLAAGKQPTGPPNPNSWATNRRLATGR